MAAKTVTKDLSGLGSIIKNYSTSSEGGFLSRIKTVVFYDVIDASLNEMYETLLNSIGKIEVNTVINGPEGETMSLDDLLTQLELLKRRIDKLYTFHYDFNMGATTSVDLQIGQKFSGTFSYKWGDFLLTQSSYIQGVSGWASSGGDTTLEAALTACRVAGLNNAESKIPGISTIENFETTLPNGSGLGLNSLVAHTKASVTFTSQLWTDPESSDLTPITSSVRLTWCVPKLYGVISGELGQEPNVTAELLSAWVGNPDSYKNYMTYKGNYNFNCSPGPVYPVFALPANELELANISLERDIFNHIMVEGFSNTRWKKGTGEITVNVNGIDTRYVWFYNYDLQTDPNLEVTLR